MVPDGVDEYRSPCLGFGQLVVAQGDALRVSWLLTLQQITPAFGNVPSDRAAAGQYTQPRP
ncbi:hypothetical protein [Streptomyces olivochromogenes]|uniref:hypothetical protein n=1 Tax=Streptomyces olivochromogenes TaxID=1963 RepID=UPI001F33A320|nr:hypothetical protein [Streptomyces olivochromogenes]MCF3134189.1 hypothetical protein [Streptomyces olivochromogenes]